MRGHGIDKIVKGLPVVRQPADISDKYQGGEVLDPDQGEDKKTGVAGHLGEIGYPVFVVPADKDRLQRKKHDIHRVGYHASLN